MSGTDKPEGAGPREERSNVLLGAQIAGFGGGSPTHHRIRNLSTGGARVDRAGSLQVGATVLVSVGGLQEVGATVVWVKNDVAGLRFVETIDPDAARSNTFLSLRSQRSDKPSNAERHTPVADPMRAGWVADLNNPYRK
ncbi:PilZ domain-containing protein [Sphingomonas sp. JC676]|uniref:PilZ domain-containing protein n=1 Tax=Sphingomonas sp. JC676 TaxID=2768065 RepID=UPI0016584EC2|nr:PilZ domain-containing protein [Sphingomonas sp. JC676]